MSINYLDVFPYIDIPENTEQNKHLLDNQGEEHKWAYREPYNVSDNISGLEFLFKFDLSKAFFFRLILVE